MNEKRTALIEAADKATPGPWIPCLGSGQHAMTAIHSDAAEGLIADFCPDYFLEKALSQPRDDEWANIKFACAARNAVEEIRASLARDKAIAAYVVELRETSDQCGQSRSVESQLICGTLADCADRLESIMEMK